MCACVCVHGVHRWLWHDMPAGLADSVPLFARSSSSTCSARWHAMHGTTYVLAICTLCLHTQSLVLAWCQHRTGFFLARRTQTLWAHVIDVYLEQMPCTRTNVRTSAHVYANVAAGQCTVLKHDCTQIQRRRTAAYNVASRPRRPSSSRRACVARGRALLWVRHPGGR